jgi:hypothetical protein
MGTSGSRPASKIPINQQDHFGALVYIDASLEINQNIINTITKNKYTGLAPDKKHMIMRGNPDMKGRTVTITQGFLPIFYDNTGDNALVKDIIYENLLCLHKFGRFTQITTCKDNYINLDTVTEHILKNFNPNTNDYISDVGMISK